MLFDLANAPATFQSYINKSLAKKLDIFYNVYLNDILINKGVKRFKNEEAVRWIWEQLQKYGLYTNLKKCRSSTNEVHFSEYIVPLLGVHIEPEQIESIMSWQQLQSILGIQVFIGIVNFYRRFIQNFSAIDGPFTSMLKTYPSSKFSKLAKKGTVKPTTQDLTSFWTKEAKESFRNLRKAFCKEPVLQHFYFSQLIRTKTDASGKAIRRVLCQQAIDMNWHSVIYYSRKMLLAEQNYVNYDAELLAIVDAFKIWRHYLKNITYTILVLTDYNNLKKL